MATFRDNTWYCSCGDVAKWYTSKKEGTSGQRFVRCPRNRETGCNFFVWEHDQEAEKQRLLPAVQVQSQTQTEQVNWPSTPPPETPRRSVQSHLVSRTPDGAGGLPTPHTGGGIGGGQNSTDIRTTLLQPAAVDVSPTPYRYHSNNEMVIKDEEENLVDRVFKLLDAGGIKLNRSVDVNLREVIDSTVFAYDARIRTLEMKVQNLELHLRQEMAANKS